MRILILLLLLTVPACADSLVLSVPKSIRISMGQSLSVPLTVRNAGKTARKLTYMIPTFWYPTVPKPLQLSEEVYDGPAHPVEVNIEAGKSVTLNSSPVLVVASRKPENRAQLLASPGRYSISFRIPLGGQQLQSNPAWLIVGR